MTDIKLQDDISITKGDLDLVVGADAGAQRVRHRLLTFIREWFLDLEFGIDYRERVLVKNPRFDVVTAVIKSGILKSIDGTFEEFEASLDSQTRRLGIFYGVQTTEGQFTDTITL